MEWPNVTPIKSTRIYQEIARQVKSMIAEGRLKGGDRLPPERDLADKFVVSRTSVREALRALESLGLVEIRPGEGTFVREASIESLVEPLALLMVSQREAIAELFEARRVLEPSLAALAAERATPEEIQEMERILDEQAREVAANRTGLAQDAQFHAAIGAAAHNRAITRITHAIMDLLTQSREESLNTPGRPHALARGSSADPRRGASARQSGRPPGDARAHRGGRGAGGGAGDARYPPARPAPDLTLSGAVRILRPTMTQLTPRVLSPVVVVSILALPGLPGASAA